VAEHRINELLYYCGELRNLKPGSVFAVQNLTTPPRRVSFLFGPAWEYAAGIPPGMRHLKPVIHLQIPMELLTDSGRTALSRNGCCPSLAVLAGKLQNSRGETVACRVEASGSNFPRHRIFGQQLPTRQVSET